MVGRGPHRICDPAPARAGCDEIEVLGTRSRTVSLPPMEDGVVVVGWKGAVMREVGWRKMGRGAEREGRRVGRWEKVLFFVMVS